MCLNLSVSSGAQVLPLYARSTFAGLAQAFKLALEVRPEPTGDGILIPDESDSTAHGGVQGAALRLRLNSRVANRIDEFEHGASLILWVIVFSSS